APPPSGGRAVRPRLGPAIAALCRAPNRRAKSLDAPGGGDRSHTRETPPPRRAERVSASGIVRGVGGRKTAALTRGASSSPLQGEAPTSTVASHKPITWPPPCDDRRGAQHQQQDQPGRVGRK